MTNLIGLLGQGILSTFWGAFHKTCHQWQMTVFVISYWNPCFWLVINRFVTDFCHFHWKRLHETGPLNEMGRFNKFANFDLLVNIAWKYALHDARTSLCALISWSVTLRTISHSAPCCLILSMARNESLLWRWAWWIMYTPEACPPLELPVLVGLRHREGAEPEEGLRGEGEVIKPRDELGRWPPQDIPPGPRGVPVVLTCSGPNSIVRFLSTKIKEDILIMLWK